MVQLQDAQKGAEVTSESTERELELEAQLVEARSILQEQGITFELDDEMAADDDDREVLQDIINNTSVKRREPKSPKDIYKAHLLEGRASAGASVDSARQNLAATFVNAFVNAGFGQDKLMTVPSDSSSGGSSANWLFKNKEHGKTSAAASLSMILLWDVDAGLAQIDKYFHLSDNHVISGALLGVGIVNCGIKNDCDPALALLGDYVDKTILEILAVL
ncbi:26S proteasome non-ATPase regulatory subunit 2 homolog A-like [Carya illinoinensis]|uniref:26S proteasome non-ATPase regulatory subunit 2 homolog A-like n=1 Tax=Carya illinoinensis TaxID=32201 RepID=UPI001C72797D|nr:26S proteasome non-ATPase regulatory subunit 2 homolog A-like [Carya illinoinensis]